MNEDFKETKFSDNERGFFLNNISRLEALLHRSITKKDEIRLIRNFQNNLGFFPLIGKPVTFIEDVERIVINKKVNQNSHDPNSRLKHYEQLKYPPRRVEDSITYNRANLKRQRVFYGGFGQLSTTLESKPEIGDLYTVSKWGQKPNTSLKHLPFIINQEIAIRPEYTDEWNEFNDLLGELDHNFARVLRATMEFFTKAFLRVVNPENPLDYLISALISDYYLNSSHSDIQVLFYPSVPSKHASSNVALNPSILDQYFDCVEVEEKIVTSKPHGQFSWLSKILARGININPKAEGKIEWEEVSDFGT